MHEWGHSAAPCATSTANQENDENREMNDISDTEDNFEEDCELPSDDEVGRLKLFF